VTLIVAALVLLGGLLWLIHVPSKSAPDPDARDQDVLNEAEGEVRDLDAMASPEDADAALPDWGPGTQDRSGGHP
jgi:hypothetical protein